MLTINNYNTDTIIQFFHRCFIGNTVVFFVAFLAPILAIISFNFVVFIIVLVVLIRHKHRHKLSGIKTSKAKEAGSTIRLMISIIGIMSIFGLTWVFGALTVDKASLAFQIIFVVLNSLQGFMIFLFFCVLGRDGRELWLETLLCGRYKSSHLHPTSATSSATKNGKKHKNVLLTPNTDSSVPVKSESTGESYVITYVEGPEKEENGEECYTTTEMVKDPIPEPTSFTFSGKETDGGVNTSDTATQNGTGSLESGVDKTAQNSESVVREDDGAKTSKSPPELKARIKRYSTKKVGKHHVESYEVDFDDLEEEETAEV